MSSGGPSHSPSTYGCWGVEKPNDCLSIERTLRVTAFVTGGYASTTRFQAHPAMVTDDPYKNRRTVTAPFVGIM